MQNNELLISAKTATGQIQAYSFKNVRRNILNNNNNFKVNTETY